LRTQQRPAVMRNMIGLTTALLATLALGRPIAAEPAPVGRVSGPVVQAVALEGDRLGSGTIRSIFGPTYINRHGDLAFHVSLERLGQQREGLFVWSGGAVAPLALEGQETGHGPLLLSAPYGGFGEWVWGDGAQALFLGAADANRDDVFDPATDPQFLFLAERGRLTPVLHVGDPLDGGTLLEILSFQVNGRGQVAFQALNDRNGDGQFDAGTDVAGIYLLDKGRAQPLVRNGDRVGDSVVRDLEYNLSSLWCFNDRAQALLPVLGLEAPGPFSQGGFGQILVDRAGKHLLARTGLVTPLGTIYSAPFSSLNNRGDVIFPATVRTADPPDEPLFPLFRVRAGATGERLEVLVQAGDIALGQPPIGGLFDPLPTLADDGSVAFGGYYPQEISFIEGEVEYPTACFIRTPESLYEVARVGYPSPWGVIGGFTSGFGGLRLNDRRQVAVQIRAQMYPFDPVYGPGIGPNAIMFWENGTRIGVVGPGDLLPGGRVDFDSRLIGLSNNGRLAFFSTITDERGVWRDGIFIAIVPGGT
jgi:hypothetical protein